MIITKITNLVNEIMTSLIVPQQTQMHYFGAMTPVVRNIKWLCREKNTLLNNAINGMHKFAVCWHLFWVVCIKYSIYANNVNKKGY